MFLDTALALDDKVVEDHLRLPRNTLSAAPAHRRSRGLAAVLVSFDRKVQAALRRLAFERMTLEARLKAEINRLQETEQNLIREPDVLNKIRVALADSDYNIRRLAGDAAPVILAALQDPEIQENLHLAMPSELNATTEEEARLWRRNLNRISIPVRVDQPYRYASHDSVTNKGSRDLHNELNKRTGEEGLSYYQKQQLKYGKGRRGSTSIAGAWEQVFTGGGGEVGLSSTRCTPGSALQPPMPQQEARAYSAWASTSQGGYFGTSTGAGGASSPAPGPNATAPAGGFEYASMAAVPAQGRFQGSATQEAAPYLSASMADGLLRSVQPARAASPARTQATASPASRGVPLSTQQQQMQASNGTPLDANMQAVLNRARSVLASSMPGTLRGE